MATGFGLSLLPPPRKPCWCCLGVGSPISSVTLYHAVSTGGFCSRKTQESIWSVSPMIGFAYHVPHHSVALSLHRSQTNKEQPLSRLCEKQMGRLCWLLHYAHMEGKPKRRSQPRAGTPCISQVSGGLRYACD